MRAFGIAALSVGLMMTTSASWAAPTTCFRMSDVQNHSVGDGKTLYLAVKGKQVYRLSMKGSCLGQPRNSDPLITETFGGTSTICRPLDLDVQMDMNGFASHCIIDKIDKLTAEEAAAIPKKLRP